MTRQELTYWIEIDVRWGDMDSQGHVNNTVYFTYCESARVALLGSLGMRKRVDGQHGPVLVTTTCDFKKQVVYPCKLDVGVRIEEIGRRSFKMKYGIFLAGADELVAVASSVNAWVNHSEGRAVVLPEEMKEALARFALPG